MSGSGRRRWDGHARDDTCKRIAARRRPCAATRLRANPKASRTRNGSSSSADPDEPGAARRTVYQWTTEAGGFRDASETGRIPASRRTSELRPCDDAGVVRSTYGVRSSCPATRSESM